MPLSPVERRHQRARGSSISALTIGSATSVALPVATSPNMKSSGIKSEARSPAEDLNAAVWPLAYDQSRCHYFRKRGTRPDARTTTSGTLGKNLGRRQQASWSLPPTPVPPRHAAHDRAAASRLQAAGWYKVDQRSTSTKPWRSSCDAARSLGAATNGFLGQIALDRRGQQLIPR
jgi:hypothetical protein